MSLEDKTIPELRKIAKDNQIRLEQGITKKELIQILEVCMKENTTDVVEPVDEDVLFDHDLGEDGVGGGDREDEIVESDVPDFTSPEWNDYVMSHFRNDELVDNHPLL